MRKEEVKMHTYYDAKEMLHKELADIVKKGELSAGSLETIDKLLNSIKNACKIIMYEEYSEDGYSYADGDMDMANYSYARGRGSQARRDSMGRYSSDDGRRMYARRGGRYSYDADDKHEKIEMLRDMMSDSNSDEERRAIQKIIRRMEQA
jgi:hypothetical protein